MNLTNALRILYRRWWLILLITAIAAASAMAYSVTQTNRYQATATVLVHPSSNANSPSVFSDELNLLSYGSLTETFASLARSPSLIRSAAARVGVSAADAASYSAAGSLIPQTTVLEVSVDGPDPGVVVRLANQLVTDVATATTTYFHIIELTPLDPASGPAVKTQPKTARNIVFGSAAGLIVGTLIAAVSIAGRRTPEPILDAASTITTWLATQVPSDSDLADPDPGAAPPPDGAVTAATSDPGEPAQSSAATISTNPARPSNSRRRGRSQ